MGRLGSFLGALGESTPGLFRFPETPAFLGPWPHPPPSQAAGPSGSSLCPISLTFCTASHFLLCLCLSGLFPYKDARDRISTGIIPDVARQGHLLSNLHSICNFCSPLLGYQIHSWIPGTRAWSPLGTIILPTVPWVEHGPLCLPAPLTSQLWLRCLRWELKGSLRRQQTRAWEGGSQRQGRSL